jgi:hypothetical protein
MKTRLSALLPLSLVGILGLATLVGAQSTPSPLGIVPPPTPQPIGINVWTDKAAYVVGETMRVYFNVNQPAYIYLYDIQPDGVVRRIFPNAYSQSNFVSAGTHILPDHPSYQYTVTHPTGEEKIQIFASLTPLALAPSVYGDPFPMVAPEEIQGHIMGISPGPTCQPTWATAWASSTITEPRASCPPPTCYAPPPPSYTPPHRATRHRLLVRQSLAPASRGGLGVAQVCDGLLVCEFASVSATRRKRLQARRKQ